nr:hypothetical protein [uncultured Cohaesibacter sp.]
MRLPFFPSKTLWPSKPKAKETIVVIGVHREEAAFGEKVASLLAGEDFGVMRVGKGLTARRPRPDQLQAYLDNHNRLYHRIAGELDAECKVMIDLHCRQKDHTDADLFAADEALLRHCMQRHASDPNMTGKCLRPVRMVSDADLDGLSMQALRSQLFSKPELPEDVWRARCPVYVGLEIYIQNEGEGQPEEWMFARNLVELVRSVCLEHQRQQERGP